MGKNMDSFTDFYDLLGVAADADERQIRRAFHSQSRLYHPDKNPDQNDATQERMKLLNRAKETLLEPLSRYTYDRERLSQQKKKEKKLEVSDVYDTSVYRKNASKPCTAKRRFHESGDPYQTAFSSEKARQKKRRKEKKTASAAVPTQQHDSFKYTR